ncbi:MAG: SDR family NAD(P)-dependent oxidoreductase, partial [Kiritimatiellae bacterium]|nr:SDR family NAD(P)-dependent oxidoreductase [Kiritimatiellia bacterium]
EECDAEAPLDLVFANAGVSAGGAEDDESAVRRVFGVNVGGVLNTLLPAIDAYRRPGVQRTAKRLAITSSLTGYHGMPQCPAYSASKACVKALGAAWRGRLAPEGISVTTVCPGFVRSRITDRNECPMPFFMEADAAARIVCRGIARGRGLVAFPWQMRFGTWLLASLPERASEALFRLLPEKTGGKSPKNRLRSGGRCG